MGERPRVPGGQKSRRPAEWDKPCPGGRAPDARAERGVAFITVLIAVSFVAIIVIACTTLVTTAARTGSWSLERTKALYAAEAGINHWLFEASIEESGAPHQHGRGHGQGQHNEGEGYGHRHRHGQGQGQGQGGGHGTSEIATIEVSGVVNGVAYIAGVTTGEGGSSGTYRIVSTAAAPSRSTVVSLEAGTVPEAWRHVVYASSTPGSLDSLLRGLLNLFGIPVYDLSGTTPTVGQLFGPVLFPWEGRDSYAPSLVDSGWGSYRSTVAPEIAYWNPPCFAQEVTADVLNPAGAGPFYYRNSVIGTIEGPVDGDLYLEDCAVGTISGPVNGGIFIRNTRKSAGVGRIAGEVKGSICIDSSQRRFDKEDMSYRSTQIGASDSRCVVGGSVYLKGRVETRGFLWWTWKTKPDVLAVCGPTATAGGPTEIAGGVFAEDASIYVGGNAEISRRPGTALPAVLSDGSVVLNGGPGPIHLSGPVYSAATVSGSLSNLVASALVDAGFPTGFAEQIGGITVDVAKWLGFDFGLIVAGDPDGGNPNRVTISGNLVTPGMPLLLGRLAANYDRSLLDPANQPPHFTGGRQILAPIRGTWAVARN
ncbi:MAG: hypothetical protein ACM3ZU_02400 [Bacteroidota bacterium]